MVSLVDLRLYPSAARADSRMSGLSQEDAGNQIQLVGGVSHPAEELSLGLQLVVFVPLCSL